MRHILNGSLQCNCAKCNRVAMEEEDRLKRLKELEKEDANENEIEEEREKHLESIRKSLRKLTSQELDDELFKLQSELHDIKKQLNEPDEEIEEEKQERDSKLEHIGVDSSLITNTRYHVLTLDQSYRDSKAGDELLILMGSRNESTKGNSKDDEFLKSLGSTD